MPEGDTILRIKRRLEPVMVGHTLSAHSPSPRGRVEGLQRLDGLTLRRIDTRGKHLLLVFEALVLHSHLGMSGSWQLYRQGAAWRRPRSSAWIVLSDGQHDAVQFGGPTLRLLRNSQIMLDPQLARLGADLLASDFDLDAGVSSLRRGEQRRSLGESLLDQTLVAGIGNIYKCESCFAVGLSPWRPVGGLSDSDLHDVLAAAREQMLAAVTHGRERFAVYRRRGRCLRCSGRIRTRGQGDANRITWWCEGCQH